MCVCSGKMLGSCGYAAVSLLPRNGKSDFAHTMLKLGKIDPRTQCNGGEVFLFTTYQTTLRYNMPLEKQQPAFAVKVQTVPLTCNNPKGQNSFQISLEIRYEIGMCLCLCMSIYLCLCLSATIGLSSSHSSWIGYKDTESGSLH